MIVLALGQKGSGKSRLIRSLAAARLTRFPQCCVLVHDPQSQWSGGHVFATANQARDYLGRGSLPRLSVIRADSVESVCALALEIGNLTCVVDELDLACSAKRWRSENARNIAHYGRHSGVDLFGSFRFTRNVNEDLPALADYVFLLRHSAGALYDLRTIGQRFGDRYAAAVQALPDHRALVWADGA